MSFVNPAPGGVEGRTDQGVDFSNIRGNIDAVTPGIITQIYQGLSGFGRTIIERIGQGQYVYYAEETGGGTPVVKAGQNVSSGQALAPGLGSGGIEVGFWNPTTGSAVGAPGYSEGAITAAGSLFRKLIGGGGTPASNPATALSGTLSFSQLQQLWINNGGNPASSAMAAAIALAESGGQQNATDNNTNGSTDRGYWQINSVHGKLSTYDPNSNAKAAISISNNGSDWSPWVTFQTGAYKKFLNGGSSLTTATGTTGGTPSGSGYGGTRPGGGSGATAGDQFADYVSLRDVRTQQTQDVSLGGSLLQSFLGQFDPAWGLFSGGLTGAASTFSDAGRLIGDTVKFIENLPWYILRSVELIVGLAMMAWGLRQLSGPADRAGAGVRNITRDVVAATPLGREIRLAQGRRQGTREGQVEHARLSARRTSRAREAEREQRRGSDAARSRRD